MAPVPGIEPETSRFWRPEGNHCRTGKNGERGEIRTHDVLSQTD
jgi:hypothetical protein